MKQGLRVPSLPILRPAWPAGARRPSGPQHRKTRKINGPATISEFSDFRANPRNLRAGRTLPPSQFCCSKHRTPAICFSFSSFPKRSHCIWHTKGALLLLILQPYFEASFHCATVVSVVGFWGPPGKQGRKPKNSELGSGPLIFRVF